MTAVAKGDLKRKLSVDAKGEIAALADTINEMIDTLATFADQVTNVAREVGVEGKLGGQARVPGAAGLWRDLTDNVNQLAANLTTQVRAIADVATAVTKGDLTRSITVEASGEVASLKDNINEMIRNLRDTTLKNTEQDWLKTNLARFTRMLQGERDLVDRLEPDPVRDRAAGERPARRVLRRRQRRAASRCSISSPPTPSPSARTCSNRFRLREGLVGQCAFEKKRILLTHVPGDYISIGSALGEAPPLNIIVLPVLFEQEVKAVIELASFSRFSRDPPGLPRPAHRVDRHRAQHHRGQHAHRRAAQAVAAPDRRAAEPAGGAEEDQRPPGAAGRDAAAIGRAPAPAAGQARRPRTRSWRRRRACSRSRSARSRPRTARSRIAKTALEEKAEQLSLTSRYKSQFLANMSHELRTPLNRC